MVLRDDFYGKMVLLDFNVWTSTDCFHQSALNLSTGIVGMVQDAEFRVSALAVQVELTILLAVEIHAPLYQFLDLLRSLAHHLLNGLAVADVVAGNHRVFNVLVEIVKLQIGHTGHTTLGKRRVGFVESGLTDDAYLALLGTGYLQGVTHTGHASSDNQEIVLVYHIYSNLRCKITKKVVILHAIMKKYCFLTLIFWLSVASWAQNANRSETFELANDSLCMKLDSLLDNPLFETSQVGLMVYDLTADTALYRYNHRQKLRPASCMKLVTSITALDQLGPEYEYQTRLFYTGEVRGRTLVGNIYCVGGFDPMLTQDDVITLAASIRNLGIDSIRGQIVADRSFKESLDYGEGWCWDDDNPMLIALTIGRKDNFTSTLAEEISRLGVNLEGVQLMQGRKPDNAQLLDVCCHSISQVLERMMKVSDNFYAESMFYQTAASVGHRFATADNARNVTRKLINRLGLNAGNYRIADGSGLSLYNYVTVELLVTLLRHAWRTPSISKALMPSLPVAGVDGTLKSRMQKTLAQGNVRAKTGTLTGISSLAGYCMAPNGHELAFAIINQGILDKTSGKAFQDRVCQVLCGEDLGVKGVKGVKKGAKATRSRQSARSARKPRGKRR